MPAQSLEVVREDIAAVSSRSVTISRPNDEQVDDSEQRLLARRHAVEAGRRRRRAAAGRRARRRQRSDRSRRASPFGIPILGQIADALADAGYIVVRYDKRGIGQSGGRAESATLADYADDVRAAVKLLAERKDVDPKRIAVVGHSEGGSSR